MTRQSKKSKRLALINDLVFNHKWSKDDAEYLAEYEHGRSPNRKKPRFNNLGMVCGWNVMNLNNKEVIE